MSYDLYFTGQRIPKSEFINYFQGRNSYQVQNDQAWYENKDTGVYFSFDYSDEAVDSDELDEDEDDIPYFASFNQNYYRPHFFALEAEPELSAFVKKFGCSVYDPQSEGMEDGRYSPEGFIHGWNCGNKFGYSAILRSEQSVEKIYTRPTAELERIWHWNYTRDRIYDNLGLDLFIPRITFALVDGSLKTMCIWPNAIATLIPYTELVYIGRKEIGSNRLEGDCIVDRSALDDILPDFDSSFPMPARNPAMECLPESIWDFVRDLQPFKGEISLVSPENVLNAEYVSEYLSTQGKSPQQE
jgi:hypothetical protein